MTLTKAGDVTLVPVPGHNPGQLAVVVDEGDHSVFLAGDSSYTEELLLRGVADGSAEVLLRPSWQDSRAPLAGLAGSFSPGPLVAQVDDPGGE